MPDADLAFYYLGDAERVLPLTVGNMNGIPKSCSNPEAALAFLDWFYGDAANVQLLVYGTEGVHYNRIEGTENRVEFTKDAICSQLYYFDNWESLFLPTIPILTQKRHCSLAQRSIKRCCPIWM